MQNDRQLKITYFSSWSNAHVTSSITTLSDYITRIYNPVRDTKTMAEYRALSKSKQDALKDVGGYIFGACKDGIRGKKTILARSELVYNIENHVPLNFPQVIESLRCAYALHATRKFLPETPRWRLTMPLNRDVTPDEFEAISRKFAHDYLDSSMKIIDATTHEPSRLMYRPSCCADAQYAIYYGDKPFLCADAVLKNYTDWQDQPLTTDLVKQVLDILEISTRLNVISNESEITGMPLGYSNENAPNTLPTLIRDFCRRAGVTGVSKDAIMDSSELGELDGTLNRNIPWLKAFLTQRVDNIRAPYARSATNHPRRTSFCATVNKEEFLLDETGNRRFWTVPVKSIDLALMRRLDKAWVQQLWLQVLGYIKQNPRRCRSMLTGTTQENAREFYGAFTDDIQKREGRPPNSIEINWFFTFYGLLIEDNNFERYFAGPGANEETAIQFSQMVIDRWIAERADKEHRISYEDMLARLDGLKNGSVGTG